MQCLKCLKRRCDSKMADTAPKADYASGLPLHDGTSKDPPNAHFKIFLCDHCCTCLGPIVKPNIHNGFRKLNATSLDNNGYCNMITDIKNADNEFRMTDALVLEKILVTIISKYEKTCEISLYFLKLL